MTALALFSIIVLIFSVVIHEISHGYMAERLGDSTARLAGRLTLNPIPHIDLFGSIILPLILLAPSFLGYGASPIVLGWAKPVPYNPYNLQDKKYGPLKVALAGPLSNILIFLVFALIIRFTGLNTITPLFLFIAKLNIFLAIFNLVPIPPLDGSKILPLIFPNFDVERIGFNGIIFVFLFIYLFSNPLNKIVTSLLLLVTGL